MAKLYPPVIASSLPAFYKEENGTAVIAVPFSMNKAVSKEQVYNFRLKIKTAQTNTYVTSLDADNSLKENFISNRIAIFKWDNLESTVGVKVNVGQYFKVQLAYIDQDTKEVGYFSTVAIVKYTSRPSIYIENAEILTEQNATPSFKKTYTGIYETTDDKTERPYSYEFLLYNEYKQLVEDSGWLLHNSILNRANIEVLQLDKTQDIYTYKTSIPEEKTYYLQYAVKTINNLEVYSKLYPVGEYGELTQDVGITLVAENIFEEGYVNIYFDGVSQSQNYQSFSIEILRAEVPSFYYINDNDTLSFTEEFGDILDSTLLNWQSLRRAYFNGYSGLINWSYKDFTIEQGVAYLYCYRYYNSKGTMSRKIASEESFVYADFEDMFLYDGDRQIKIRFNPKVSSFKINHLEQKTDTIGSRYPFIFRNGVVEYKEFPISGLISYKADNNRLFIRPQSGNDKLFEEDLGIILPDEYMLTHETLMYYQISKEEAFLAIEDENVNNIYYEYNNQKIQFTTEKKQEIETEEEKDEEEQDEELLTIYNQYKYFRLEKRYENTNRDNTPSLRKIYQKAETLDSIGYNMRAERRFKLKLLEWLGDGKIKLFKSGAEGNYLVRLMNVSLSPEDKLGRMLHTFSATAYEVEELTYENLMNLGFIKILETEATSYKWKSIDLGDFIAESGETTGFLAINTNPVIDYISVEQTGASPHQIYLWLGIDEGTANKVLITTNKFVWQTEGNMPNIYINLSATEYSGQDLKATLKGVIVTYHYIETELLSGEIVDTNSNKVDEIYAKTEIQTFSGPTTIEYKKDFYSTDGQSHSYLSRSEEIIQFYVLDFKKKPTREIYFYNGEYYEDSTHQNKITIFDILSLYKVEDVIYYYNGSSLQALGTNSNKITLDFKDDESTSQTFEFEDNIPNLNIAPGSSYKRIIIGDIFYLNSAYQKKVITYRA